MFGQVLRVIRALPRRADKDGAFGGRLDRDQIANVRLRMPTA